MSKFKEGDIVRSTGNPDYTYRIVEVLDDSFHYDVVAHRHIATGRTDACWVTHEIHEFYLYKA